MTPFMPGTKVEYAARWWTVGAVGLTGGERYYWLVRLREVAMIPAFVLEEKR